MGIGQGHETQVCCHLTFTSIQLQYLSILLTDSMKWICLTIPSRLCRQRNSTWNVDSKIGSLPNV